MVEVYTSYFSNYKNIPSEYQCVSIANSRPSSICIPIWSDVIPHWSLVKAFKNKSISSNEFMGRYIEMLKSKPLENYKNFLMQYKYPIVLLCWEKDCSWCHRSLLGSFLKVYLHDIVDFKGELNAN